jgi:TP901 family phage tail tape measure protein
VAGTEVGKGYVGISADTKGLQSELTSLGGNLGAKLGPVGALLGNKLGSSMGGGMEKGLGGSKSGIAGLAGMLGETGPYGIAAAAAVAATVGVGTALYKMGSDFETQYRTIARDTGATGKDLANLEQSFRNVAKSGPSSFADVTTAITEVQRMTGTTGPNLEGLSKQFLTLSRITGTDLKTNVDSGSKALEQWDLHGKDATTAMNQMFTASQKTGVTFSSLSGNVTKFAPQLRTMGYSFSDSTSMLASFEQHGVNTSKVMAAMQIAGAKFAKAGVKDIPAAMDATITAIKGASNQTDALNIAAGAFGSRGAVQMVQAVRGGQLDFGKLSKEVKGSGDSINDTAKRTATLGGSFATLKNATAVALEPLSTAVFKGITQGLIGMTKALTVAATWLGTNLPGAMEHTTNAFKDVAHFFAAATRDIYNAITPLRQMIGATFTTAARLMQDAYHVIQPIIRMYVDIFKVLIDLLTGNWQGAWNAAKDAVLSALRALAAVPKLLFDYITAPFANLGPGIANALQGFWTEVSSIPGKVVGFLSSLGGAVFGAIAGGFSTAAGAAGAALGSFFGTVAALPGQVVRFLSGLGGAVFGAIAGGFSTAAGAAAGALGGLWSVVSGIPHQIITALGDLGGLLKDAGRALIQGLINGIGSLAGAVEDKIKSVVTAPINAAKGILGIHSPSTVFHDLGRNTVQGYINGMESLASATTNTLNHVLPDFGGGSPMAAGSGAGGPAVVIQTANFNSDVDIDHFMKRVAWVAQTAGV